MTFTMAPAEIMSSPSTCHRRQQALLAWSEFAVTGCVRHPYCRRAKAVFKELELKKDPYVVKLDQREDGGEIQYALSDMVGKRTVPQVFIRGKHLGGSDDTVDAYESGELAKLLNISVKDDL
ncbi:glutaredoxin-C8-like [Hordeum vulgare subsp. vulgare]|uniref:glutaredoxin-C8-like n=1 Tax=Hordeum vulgare subsp. vulgare TaxID=112509 RepID=UPI001D1A45C4|nr:glutaredoxin-C8-like [Hordeum vulgare subsp. vulgare]